MDLDYPSRKSSPPRFTIPPPPLPVVPLEEMASAPKRKLQECPSGETGAKRKETKPEVKKEEPTKKKEEQMEVDETSSSTATLTEPSVKPKEKRKSMKIKKEPAKTPEAESSPVPASAAQENTTAPVQMSEAEKTKSLKKKKKVAEMNGETPKDPTPAKPVPAEESLLPATIEAVNSTTTVPESPKAPKQLAAEVEPLIPTPVLEKSMPVEPPKAPAAATVAAAPAQEPKDTAPVEAVKAETVKEGSPVKSAEGAVKRRPQTLKYRTKTEDLSSKTKSVSPEKSVERREIPRNDVRRKSSIFEKAEMFNNMSANNLNRASPEKGKKLNIGGVNISDFKTAFEKKAPAKSASTAVASGEPTVEALKKPAAKSESPQVEKKAQPAAPAPVVATPQPKAVPTAAEPVPTAAPAATKAPEPIKSTEAAKPVIKPAAVEAPEIKPRAAAVARETTPKLPARQASPPKMMPIKAKTPDPEAQKKKSTTMKIILDSSPKSATLPRRTSKAEIKLNSPPTAPLIPPTQQQKTAEYR